VPRQVEINTPLEELLVEQALLMARELQAAADAAPDGRVLADAEQVAVRAGRELTRRALEAALQSQAEQAEKKGPPAAPAAAASAATPRAGRAEPPSPPPATPA
jgi:hypothetical protein